MTVPKLAPHARLRWDHRGERFMLLYPERGLVLNDAAYAALSLCDGQRPTHEIARILAQRFDSDDIDSVVANLDGFLGRLHELGVLESAECA
jgi:coenzyme PQQ biosynthesis protein PqqD